MPCVRSRKASWLAARDGEAWRLVPTWLVHPSTVHDLIRGMNTFGTKLAILGLGPHHALLGQIPVSTHSRTRKRSTSDELVSWPSGTNCLW